jgi:hypothetical protein
MENPLLYCLRHWTGPSWAGALVWTRRKNFLLRRYAPRPSLRDSLSTHAVCLGTALYYTARRQAPRRSASHYRVTERRSAGTGQPMHFAGRPSGAPARWQAGPRRRRPNTYDTDDCRAPIRGEPYEAATAAQDHRALPWTVPSSKVCSAVYNYPALDTRHDNGRHRVCRSAYIPPRGKWTRCLAGDRSPHGGTGGRRDRPRPLHVHPGSPGNTRRDADLYVAGTDHIRPCPLPHRSLPAGLRALETAPTRRIPMPFLCLFVLRHG